MSETPLPAAPVPADSVVTVGTPADASAPARLRAPPVVELLLRPDAFFASVSVPIRGRRTVVIIVLVGLAGGIDRAVIKGSFTTWSAFWEFALRAAVLAGPLRWFVGRAWFRARLRLAGASRTDSLTAQTVFGYSELVDKVPFLLVSVMQSLTLPSPAAAPWSPTALMAFLWSVLVSYRGVRASFPVSPWRSRVWFLILPLIYYAVVIARSWGWWSFPGILVP